MNVGAVDIKFNIKLFTKYLILLSHTQSQKIDSHQNSVGGHLLPVHKNRKSVLRKQTPVYHPKVL